MTLRDYGCGQELQLLAMRDRCRWRKERDGDNATLAIGRPGICIVFNTEKPWGYRQ
jgi:hypothetical protein